MINEYAKNRSKKKKDHRHINEMRNFQETYMLDIITLTASTLIRPSSRALEKCCRSSK